RENGEDGQCRRVQPWPEEPPAARRGLLSLEVHEGENRRDREGSEPEPRRELELDPRRRPGALAERGEHAVARARGRSGADEAPDETRRQQREPELDRSEQERVVVGARVARRADVPPDVDPVGKAAAGELRDERKQRERESREEPLVPTRTLHPVSVPERSGVPFKEPCPNR